MENKHNQMNLLNKDTFNSGLRQLPHLELKVQIQHKENEKNVAYMGNKIIKNGGHPTEPQTPKLYTK